MANIAVFLDGTWNDELDGKRNKGTNVLALYQTAKGYPDQHVYYLDGIGTDHAGSRWKALDTFVENIFGGAFGHGMGDRIKDAYRFLSKNYQRGDNVYIFGFSRGAFAARSLAGFVDAVGLLLANVAENSNFIETAYAAYENDTDREHNVLKQYLRSLDFPEAPAPEQTDLPIYFLGVWDTVAALGLPGRADFFTAPFTEFHQTELPGNVTHARHALALHETRTRFVPLLWQRPSNPRQTLQQVWFPGAHSDVGGGYSERIWSDIALDWMATEAASKGLKLGALPKPPGSPTAPIHNSISGLFAFATSAVREPVGLPENLHPETASTFSIHESALDRLSRPMNLAYDATRIDVRDTFDVIDKLTARLHAWLIESVEGPDPVHRAAADDWWRDLSWNTTSALGDVWSLAAPGVAGGPTPSPFERALLFQIVCSNGRVPDTLTYGFRQATKNRPAIEQEALTLIGRADSVLSGIDAIVSVLPARLVSNLVEFRKEVADARQTLVSHVHLSRLRARFDKT